MAIVAQTISTFLLQLCYILIFITIDVCSPLRINRFDVPPAIARGQSALLHCNFDLEGDELYSVKYYKDYVEFYRYMPSEDRPAQKFKLRGAYVDIYRSNASHAVLTHTDLYSDGMYACEISTEGPSYSTMRSEQLMKVYVLPQENLKIEGKELLYGYNDKINLSCKSGDGRPFPHLLWFINDKMATVDQLIYYPHQTNSDGLQRSKLDLVFHATPNHFHRGELNLRCKASMTLVYEFEAVEYLIGGTTKNKSHTSSYSWRKDWSLQPNRQTPVIKGVKQSYHVNDVLNMNCTSAAHDAQLKWFVTNIEASENQLIKYRIEETGNKQVLGLRFPMERKHFQIQELKLRCVALFHRNIAEFQEQITIRTYNQDFLEPQSANAESKSNLAIHENNSCLTNLLTIKLMLSIQVFYYYIHRSLESRIL